MDPELQRGKAICPELHSRKEMEAGCELSLAESEAPGLCARNGHRVDGRIWMRLGPEVICVLGSLRPHCL